MPSNVTPMPQAMEFWSEAFGGTDLPTRVLSLRSCKGRMNSDKAANDMERAQRFAKKFAGE